MGETSPHKPYKIVTAIDFSDMSEVVLETAIDLATRHPAPEVHALTVLTPPRSRRKREEVDLSGELAELASALCDLVDEKLADFGHPRDKLEDWRIFTHTRMGDPTEEIVALAWEAEADIIILGRHSDTLRRRFIIGSVPQRVMHLTRCPVLVAQPTDYAEPDASDETRPRPQCTACVATRRESSGNRWFCPDHSDIRVTRSMYMAHHTTTSPIGGGPLL